MELCSLCKRIKEIREQQGKDYYNDLCPDCQEEIKEKYEKALCLLISD